MGVIGKRRKDRHGAVGRECCLAQKGTLNKDAAGGVKIGLIDSVVGG